MHALSEAAETELRSKNHRQFNSTTFSTLKCARISHFYKPDKNINL